MSNSLCMLVSIVIACIGVSSGYAFVSRKTVSSFDVSKPVQRVLPPKYHASSSLKMIDQQVLMGGGIALAGLAAGIGLVAFTEQQGERARERGAGLSDSMSTRIAGGLLEDVEVSSVEDLGTLTSQLEKALKEAGGADESKLEMTEEEKQKIMEEADDGW
jgi:hypothetical protein